jgi:hypothetical protein
MHLVIRHDDSDVQPRGNALFATMKRTLVDTPMFKVHWLILDVAILIAVFYN